MKKLSQFFRLSAGICVAGLFMVILLTACMTGPLVTVQCAPTGAATVHPVDVRGACNAPVAYTGDAYGFYNTETKATITDHNHTCTDPSSKCQAVPGKCYFGGPDCKSYFTPSSAGALTGTCACGCPP